MPDSHMQFALCKPYNSCQATTGKLHLWWLQLVGHPPLLQQCLNYMQLNQHLYSNCILQTHIGSQQPTYKLHVALQQAAHPPVINMGSNWSVHKQSHCLYTAPLYIGVFTYMYMLPKHLNLSPSRVDSGVTHFS